MPGAWFLGGVAEGLAQFFGGGLFFDFSGEIDDRDSRGRDAQRIAINLPFRSGMTRAMALARRWWSG